MKDRIILMVYLLLGTAAGTLAATHWTVNPHAFQYDMTVYVKIASAQQDGYEVAAFYGDECRGVAKLLTANDGTKVFQLRVRSNVVSGEVITFKAYHASTGKESAFNETVTFEAQGVEGSPSEPLELTFSGLIRGNANGDGKVDIADVTAIINKINGVPPLTFNETAADVNKDGVINIADVTGVINIINQ